MAEPLFLVADVGGTNTRVALARGGTVDPSSVRRFANAEFAGLSAILTSYLGAAGSPEVDGTCVAVAGPVDGEVARLTNLDWTIGRDDLARATGAARIAVINDLQAQGYALGQIAADRLRELIRPAEAPRAPSPQLVIGVGTGFNAAVVHDGAAGRLVTASECGHATLPVRSEADLSLMRFVETAHGFAGVEDVLSGRGLERVHAWAQREAGRGQEPRRDASAIMEAIGRGDDPVAEAAGSTFVRLLGRVAGDLALIHLPFGGIHLIGGVARAFTPHFERFGFAAAFRDKGRFAPLVAEFPVRIIEDDFAALTGCARRLAES